MNAVLSPTPNDRGLVDIVLSDRPIVSLPESLPKSGPLTVQFRVPSLYGQSALAELITYADNRRSHDNRWPEYIPSLLVDETVAVRPIQELFSFANRLPYEGQLRLHDGYVSIVYEIDTGSPKNRSTIQKFLRATDALLSTQIPLATFYLQGKRKVKRGGYRSAMQAQITRSL